MTSNDVLRVAEEAARIYRDAKLSAQTQFEYSKRWRSVDRWLGAAAALGAAFSGVAGLADLLSNEIVGLVALCAAFLATLATTLAAPANRQRAHDAANRFLALEY